MRRRMLINPAFDNDLPDGYKRVNYLESTGAQYIDSLIIPTTGTIIHIKISGFPVTGVDEYVFGIREGNDNFSLGQYNNAYVSAYGNIQIYPMPLDYNDVMLDILFGSKKLEIKYPNSKTLTATFNAGGLSLSKHLSIFAWNKNNQITNFSKMKLYLVSIMEKDEVIADMIPCLDNNKTPCLYDTVRKQTFYNSGSGEFTYG